LPPCRSRAQPAASAGTCTGGIAQHLFITLPTVETHLRHAFHKLGITSRTGLPAQLASRARPGSLLDDPAQAVTATRA
jgi:DNA-binding NarL/FixJ family response regulator